ncbi:MAG: Co2+/Mg2+ efflux protein ApaG [Sediminibacterium sp.]|nr:Co2+/Mg2+ efflux protein ApaG [Sediminibacterium sp.]
MIELAWNDLISISVKTIFQEDYSNPKNKYYVFSYVINIANNNTFSIQLLSRFWHIVDCNFTNKIVEGAGVVGETPIILPNEFYQYSSACILQSGIGKMQGYYTFKNLNNNKLIHASIQPFSLVYPFLYN